MSDTFSSEQIFKTVIFDANLILRQCELDLMFRLIELKSINPKLRRGQMAKKLSFSSYILQRYRHDMKMQSPYKSNGPKRKQKSSNDMRNLKRPQKT